MEPNDNILSELITGGKRWLKNADNVFQLQRFFASLPAPSELRLEHHEQVCFVLSVALESQPNLWHFARHYLSRDFPPFKRFLEKDSNENNPPPPKKSKPAPQRLPDVALFHSCYVFLRCNKFFKRLWEWDRLYDILPKVPGDCQWLIVECLGRVNDWCHEERESQFQIASNGITYDFMALDFLTIAKDWKGVFDDDPITSSPRSPGRVVEIGGSNLLTEGTPITDESESPFVNVPSREILLRRIVDAISVGTPVLLEGPIGCGKTKLVEYLAKTSGRREFNQFHRINMSDRTDARALIGGYTCHDVPGKFSWEDGILTRAVKKGDWLLVEDIDLAPSDVMSTLMPLIERGELYLPSKGEIIEARPGFQLFLTYRSGNFRPITINGTCRINVGDFNDDELAQVCCSSQSPIANVVPKMVLCYMALKERQMESDFSSRKRLFSIRDLKKWCKRCAKAIDVSSETVVLEGLDCFTNYLPAGGANKMQLIQGIGQMFNLSYQNIEHLALERFPNLTVTSSALRIGRVTVPRNNQAGLGNPRPFYLTKQASRLVEFIATSINNKEPVLLVGETGVGKTSAVQYLSNLMGKKLITVNLSQQTESGDLLGGFKPVDFEHFVMPVLRHFEDTFRATFSAKENAKFLAHLHECRIRKRWSDLVQLMVHASRGAISKDPKDQRWRATEKQLDQLQQNVGTQSKLLFSFVNGALTNAIQEGDWILLDEVNMADTEVLECLADVMNPEIQSLCLYGGSEKLIRKHTDFQMFACMNPATDVGKKELPDGLRNRFTEYYIDEPQNEQDLILIVQDYLKSLSPSLDLKVFKQVVKFFFSVKQLADKKLLDGTGHKPTYSLRTLCRALDIAAQNFCQNSRRSLLEAFLLCFLTELDRTSYPIVFGLILKHFGKGEAVSSLKTAIAKPPSGLYVSIEGYWITAGENIPIVNEDFILTETVRQNLKDVARVVSLSKFAVLLQGETSVGKTSLITYLAKASGNKCLRINNHEHTDIQEYVGAYCMDQHGNFTFQEGVLARAMRLGCWIILDELNLAPSDVLEALNRVLDDNRELFVPETQTLIKAHPSFRIFATQNPSGSSYGGRKTLSRAFRNRFIELHFNELPSDELSTIIEKRCKISGKASKKLITVMQELQINRKSSAALEGKRGFLTLRDLFRWADRCSLADQPTQFYDWERHFAEEGFLVLASKIRVENEVEVVKKCLEKVFKRHIRCEDIFALSEDNNSVTRDDVLAILKSTSPGDIVWTQSATRMAIVALHSLRFREPVLLVGETGCGKTQVCQTISRVLARTLLSINCHLNTESSDFLGGLRPNRSISEDDEALFRWVDGPLINAMVEGSVLLVDEISLADDSVLERLNSILEPDRTLFLIEETSSSEFREIVAHPDFQFVATMNPGGDYGKKELSPALRNRMVEVWCPSECSQGDLSLLVRTKLIPDIMAKCLDPIIQFAMWYRSSKIAPKVPFTLRDLLSWIDFVNKSHFFLDIHCSLVHGICLVLFDGLGTALTGESLESFKISGQKFFQSIFEHHICDCFKWITARGACDTRNTDNIFGVSSFEMEKTPNENLMVSDPPMFSFDAPTVASNTLKVLRAMQVDSKAILLEGLPSAGKSSLVGALARITGNVLVRINLSDQTEISDLFGADLPSSDGSSLASFCWHDGPFLAALKAGHWILLDELNLATQSVLEGLNACLDHRGTVFIPELNRSFEIAQKQTRIFGCQNPPREGGERKNLPKSFLNRFFKVYLTELSSDDLSLICRSQHPELDPALVSEAVSFSQQLSRETCLEKTWGYSGSPWQFNLRDLLRFCQAISNRASTVKSVRRIAKLVFLERFRMDFDRERGMEILEKCFSGSDPQIPVQFHISSDYLVVNSSILKRTNEKFPTGDFQLDRGQFEALESLMFCIEHNWLAILVGQEGSGKTSLINILSDLLGHPIQTITLTSASDTSELIGGFEQVGSFDKLSALLKKLVKEVSDMMNFNTCTLTTWQKLSQCQMKLKEAETNQLSAAHVFQMLGEIESLSGIAMEYYKSMLKNLQNDDKTSFDWMDSLLVRAITNGDWVILDNANNCNAAVLDRLNALLEPNGVLVIGERGCDPESGKVHMVKPHKDFRLFLTINPLHGELSPAIRNRGVEIFLPANEAKKYEGGSIKELAGYPSVAPMVHQMKLLEEMSSRIGMPPSFAAKAFLAFASSTDLDSRASLFKANFEGSHDDLFFHLKRLLTTKAFNSTLGPSNAILGFLNSYFTSEILRQTPKYFAQFSIETKQLWTDLVAFATRLLSTLHGDGKDLSGRAVVSALILGHLLTSMKSKLENASTENTLLKEWSIIWFKLKTILDDEGITYDDTSVDTCLGSYFNAFNLLVRKFWQDFGLEAVHTKNLDELNNQKIHLSRSLELSGLLKVDGLVMSCNINALRQVFSWETLSEALPTVNDDIHNGNSEDRIYKLQVILLSAWNAMTQNRLFLAAAFNRLRPSLLFPMDSNHLIKSLQHSCLEDITLKQKLLIKIHSVDQEKVTRHVFEQLQPANLEATTAQEDMCTSEELSCLAQIMTLIKTEKSDYFDVSLSKCKERRLQMVAILTKLVADQNIFRSLATDVRPVMLKSNQMDLKRIVTGVISLARGSSSGILTINDEIDFNEFALTVQESNVFPSALKTVLIRISHVVGPKLGSTLTDGALMKLASGLIMFHMSSELGRVDISEHMKATAEATETIITLSTNTIMADDTCRTLTSVEEPIQAWQAEWRHLLSDYVQERRIELQEEFSSIPIRHPEETFDNLVQEIVQLKNSVLSLDTIEALLAQIFGGQDLDRLQSWEHSISKVVEHLKPRFSSYEDVWIPILAGISDVLIGLKELKNTTLKSSSLESFDLSRYLMNEIDHVPERSLDVVLASRTMQTSTANDVLRDLGKFWLLRQQEVADGENPPDDSFVYKFRGLDAEETAEQMEKKNDDVEKSTECPTMFRDLLNKVRNKSCANHTNFKDDHLRATYHRVLSERATTSTPVEERLLYLAHCQEIASSLKKQTREVEKLRPILDQMKTFISENVSPYNDEHPVLESIIRKINEVLSRSILENPKTFLIPVERLVQTLLEWNKHVPRNQIIAHKEIFRLVLNWRKADLTWNSIMSDITAHMSTDIHDCALALWPIIEEAINGNLRSSKKPLCAPIVLFFTSAFTGDYAERLVIIDQMGDIVRSVNPEVGRLIHAVTVYFRAFSSGIESRQKDKLKKVKQKFEVAVKAGKLFEEEKLRHHYKDTTKVRRDTSLQILKILKEPAMKYSFDRKAPDDGTQSDLVTQPLFHFSESGSELPASTFVFTSESGKPLGGIADLSVKSKTLIQKMNAIFMEKTSVNDELEIKRAQLVALQADLKRSVSQDQKCKFHPTQKAIANMLADLRLYGLRPLYGAKFELQTISLLSELYVPLTETSNLVNQTTNFMFHFEELKASFYKPEKCAKAFPTCSKGYDQLSHGMLQLLKAEKFTEKFREEVTDLKGIVTKLTQESRKEIHCWISHLKAKLLISGDICSRIIDVIKCSASDPNYTSFFVNGEIDSDQIKRNSEKIWPGLSEYSSIIEAFYRSLENDFIRPDDLVQIATDHITRMDNAGRKSFLTNPCLVELTSLSGLHFQFQANLSQIKSWKMKLQSQELPETIVTQFEASVQSTSYKCLIYLQEASKAVKKLNIIEDEKEESGHFVSTFDRSLAVFKTLSLRSVLTHFKSMNDFLKLCCANNYNLSPLMDILRTFCPIFEVFYEYCQVLQSRTDDLFNEGCRYLSQCASVMKTFLLYDFGKIDQEEGEDGEMTGDVSGTGLGDGKADKATTDDLESEDVFEGAEKPKNPEEEDNEEENEEGTNEEDGVEMSGDLDAQMQDKENENGDNPEDSDKEDEDKDEEMLDNEEGDTDPDKGLDEQVWNDEEEENIKEDEELQKEERSNSDAKEKKEDPRGQNNPEEEEQDHRQKNTPDDQEKRERDEEEGAEEEGQEEIDMKDGVYGDENNEPPEAEDFDLPEDINLDDNEGEESDNEENMETDLPDEKLPDFADAEQETPMEDESCEPEVDTGNEEPAGHDRQDTNLKDSDRNPLTTEKDDEKANEQQEDKGTELDGLQDEDGRGDTDKTENVQNDEKEEDANPNEEMANDEVEKGGEDEERNVEPEESVDKVEQKMLTSESNEDEGALEKKEMEQLFAHSKDIDKCTEKTVDRAEDDEKFENQDMEFEDDQEENDHKKAEKPNNYMRKFEQMELADTETVQRSDETVMGTNENLCPNEAVNDSSRVDLVTEYRTEITSEEMKEWLQLCSSVHELSGNLTEQLRLILEPTKATKFKGDFKSGKKLNMRKIIPFIASNYRKDKIWLRRTKPSKRDYHVLVAVDDSSSMNENDVRRTTYQSLAALCQGLSTLEVGKLGLISFGNEAKLIHPIQASFAHDDGAHLLKMLKFDQTATNVAKMLDVAKKAFSESSKQGDAAKLLLILSDGRGIFNEGQDRVLTSVRNLLLSNTFVIFVIMENVNNKDSVLDMRVATFDDNNRPTIVSYMEQFPFPYYMILKNINALPQSLSDALRQWFAFVSV